MSRCKHFNSAAKGPSSQPVSLVRKFVTINEAIIIDYSQYFLQIFTFLTVLFLLQDPRQNTCSSLVSLGFAWLYYFSVFPSF